MTGESASLELRAGRKVIVAKVDAAASVRRRMRGLLGRSALDKGQALYLAPCRLVHTFFMRFPLDLVFVSKTMEVVRVARNVKPGRVAWGGWASRSVFEMEAGWLPRGLVVPGDRLELVKASSREPDPAGAPGS
jgi:uncharacterized membrane protein (UPF0127 family)